MLGTAAIVCFTVNYVCSSSKNSDCDSNKRPLNNVKSSSQQSKISHSKHSNDKFDEITLKTSTQSLSQFSEGVGENKIQVNQRKVSFSKQFV